MKHLKRCLHLLIVFLETVESSQEITAHILNTNMRSSTTKFNTPEQLNMFQQQLRNTIEVARNSVKKTNDEKHKNQVAWEEAQRITNDYLIEHQIAQTRMQKCIAVAGRG